MSRISINRRFLSEDYDDNLRITTMHIPDSYLEFMKNAAKPLGYGGFAHMMLDITSMIIRPPENREDELEQIIAIKKAMPQIEKVIKDTIQFYMAETGIQQHEEAGGKVVESVNSVFKKDNPNVGKTVPIKLKTKSGNDEGTVQVITDTPKASEIAASILRKCFYINLDLKGLVLLEVFLNTKKHRPLYTPWIGTPEDNMLGKPISEKDLEYLATENIPLNSVVMNLILGNETRVFLHRYSPTVFHPTKVFCVDQGKALKPMVYAREGKTQSPVWEHLEGHLLAIYQQFVDIETDAPELAGTDIYEEVVPIVTKMREGKAKDKDKLALYEIIENYIEQRIIAGLSMSQALENFSLIEFSDNPNFPVDLNVFLQREASQHESLEGQNIYDNLVTHDAWIIEEDEDEDEEA